MPNGLGSGTSNPSGSVGEIKSFEEQTKNPKSASQNRSYPEAEPCTPAGLGSPLSYSGKKGVTDEPRTYEP